jgi:methionine synthase I (cobalamin-dependent)
LEETAILYLAADNHGFPKLEPMLSAFTESREYIMDLLRAMQDKGLIKIVYGCNTQSCHIPAFIEFSSDDDPEDVAIEYALKELQGAKNE